MRTALVVAAHHLRRMVKNPGLLLLFLAIPLTLAAIEYAAFGRTAAAGKLPPIHVLFLDEDDTFLSQAVPQIFTGGEMKDQFETSSVKSMDEARTIFRRGEASALVRVAKGFQGAILDGQEVAIQVYRNPGQTFSPDVVESVLEIGAVLGNGLYLQAKEPLSLVKKFVDEDREPTTEEVAAAAVGFFLAAKRLGKLGGLDDMDVRVQRPGDATSQAGRRGPDPGEFFAIIYPGLTIFSLMFVGQALVFRLLRDRVRGIQRRLVMVTASPMAVLTGGVLYLIAGLMMVTLALALVGSAVFQITLREPLALAALGLGFASFAAGLMLSIAAVSRDDKGAAGISSVAIILLSLLGGSMVPLDALPGFLRSVATTLPNGAVQSGMTQVLVHGKTLSGIAGQTLVVWSWAVVALLVAGTLEIRRMTR